MTKFENTVKKIKVAAEYSTVPQAKDNKLAFDIAKQYTDKPYSEVK